MKQLFLTLIFGWSTNLICAQTGIEAVLDGYKKDKDLRHAQYSFCIMEASTSNVLKEYNSEMALIPASTMKIITTSAALGILGKDYTYKTNYNLLYNAPLIENATETQLYIEGCGDPSFNSSYFYNSDSLFFSPLINKLILKKATNISSISTNTNYFDNAIPSSWIWGDIGNYFGAGANGLSYKDNKFSIFYNSEETNSTATIESISPNYFSNTMSIQSQVKSNGTEDNAFVFGDPNTFSRIITGTIPPNKKHYEVEAQMPEPHLFFEYELKKVLDNYDLMSKNKNPSTNIKETDTTFKTQLIYTHISPKLSKIVYFTNTKSNNHFAESLLKTLGAIKSGKQGTTENGIEAVANFWKSRGVDVSGLHMEDGSGLSRANTITTKIQATVLSKIYRDSTMYASFNASLPVAGKNGSMINLCKGTFAENNMRAKTGYINRARGYCGYVKTKSGKELAFSVLFNNYDCSPKDMKLKIEKLLVALVDL
jgi:D-alanyl-D-alanine carboxypeptidase/D-alanyl-D-alanine-endopeptidase (penicillin-binding protein 4)